MSIFQSINDAIENSCFTKETCFVMTKISAASFRKWEQEERKPQARSIRKLEIALDYIKKTPSRLEKHPSYGYATPEQISRLNSLGICPERNKLLEQISKQSKMNGKIQ